MMGSAFSFGIVTLAPTSVVTACGMMASTSCASRPRSRPSFLS